MELWIQIAIGIVVGESILLILKGLKGMIGLYVIFDNGHCMKDPESIMKEAKTNMKKMCIGAGFGLTVGVLLYILAVLGCNSL